MDRRRQLEKIGQFFFRHRDHLPGAVVVAAFIGLYYSHSDFATGRPGLEVAVPVVAFFLILAGEALRIWSVGFAGTTTRAKSLQAPSLATTGPYGVVRNPIYVGNFLLGLGFVLLPRVSWLLVLYVLYFALQYSLIVFVEEQFLTGQFGDDYLAYKKRVRRFWPSFSGLLRQLKNPRDGSENFSWRALRGEKWTLLNMLFFGVVLFVLNHWFRS